ncbi:hypothetical protein [Caballeronia sp. LZ001]|uniref:hypothetical protein n=1 Tax=Caballeronia sp. LZ001 TaxID=3038553 RepID=UPI0028593061|nr:hypothetical protein [Caballeronia sp. LZ001]MDR5803731.1 hypothetical protein [Caballeronia sp. LZ001]
MLRTIIVSALLTTTVTAFAGQHYVEVWDPPEARGDSSLGVGHQHKPARKRVAPVKRATVRSKQRGMMKSVAAPVPTSAAPEQRRPTFDEIPRKRTPRGDVLRVHGDTMRVHVER